ncbi:MAG: DUF4159 domain-containing protein [Planctomycetes bacterium]|nr:DUF4159 domain-containing protein [Planctomycetota bacterium]
MNSRSAAALALFLGLFCCETKALGPPEVECANLVYARTKSAVCFSDGFLKHLRQDTSIRVDPHFRTVKLNTEEIYTYPFAIMSGEGSFRLTDMERHNLRAYLTRGGFLLASAGCSNKHWDRSFRNEMRKVFPDFELVKLPMDHPVFRTVYHINRIITRHGRRRGYLEGMFINGRLVMIYAALGLNSTRHVRGCCCCGGSEIRNADEINVNVMAYALLH